MGRRRGVATVVVSSGGDSSTSSAESSFREHDDVFLQTQTRIWLGEVVKRRLDDQVHISDLLADGELLFEVSKRLWSMLLVKCVELRHLKAYQSPLGYRKSSGRYMPYSNVDSFLKICKILGLDGIDLLSPSDVVEKRNIRKVCICIRALSKKARSKQLNVPDFDVVSYTVAMPTDMVEYIRRSLESSQCSFSSSSSYSSCKDAKSKIKQKSLISESDRNYASSSDESDEAESKYHGIETYCSSETKCDDPATRLSDLGNLSSAFSAVKHYTAMKSASQLDMGSLFTSEVSNGESKSPSLSGTMNSLSFVHSRDNHNADHLSSCQNKPKGNFHDSNSHVNNDLQGSYENITELSDVDLDLNNDASNFGDSLFENLAERDFISDYLAFSDSVVLGTDGSSPIFFEGEDNICNFFRGIDCDQSGSNWRTLQKRKSSDDMEDVEVSSTASMSSILGRVLNMDFDDQFDAGDSSILKVHFTGSLENEVDSECRGSFQEDQAQDLSQFENLSHCSATNAKDSQNGMKLENLGFCAECQDGTCQGGHKQINGILASEDFVSPANEREIMAEQHTISSSPGSGDIIEAGDQARTDHNENILYQCECTVEDDREHKNLDISAENVLERIKDQSSGMQKGKLWGRPVLKTVVRGTALVGLLFLLLHLRRRGKQKTDEPSKQFSQPRKLSGAKSPSQKGQSGSANGTYPAEKLKFGK